jgi:hypothetical protein
LISSQKEFFMSGKRNIILIALLLCSVTISACAVTNKENRLVLNSLDNAVEGSFITRSTTGKVVAAPIALPVGVTAGLIDMAVVTPVRAMVPAAEDTNTYLWKDPQGSDLRQMMLFVPKIAATPVVFVTDWAFRSVFSTKL